MSGVPFRPGCPICFEPLEPDAIYSLPCGHTFDEKCIRNWLRESKTCPSCRVPTGFDRLVKVHFAFSTSQRTVDVETVDNAHSTTIASSKRSKPTDSHERAKSRSSACHGREGEPLCGDTNAASNITPKRDDEERAQEEGSAITRIVAQARTRNPTRASLPPPYRVSRVLNLLNVPCWPPSYGPYLTALCISAALTILLFIASIICSLTGRLKENTFPEKIGFWFGFQLIFVGGCIQVTGMYFDERRRVASSRVVDESTIYHALRNVAMFLELFYCIFALFVLVAFFHPFMLLPSDRLSVMNNGTSKTYYFWSEFVVVSYPFLVRSIFLTAVFVASECPRGEAFLKYLA